MSCECRGMISLWIDMMLWFRPWGMESGPENAVLSPVVRRDGEEMSWGRGEVGQGSVQSRKHHRTQDLATKASTAAWTHFILPTSTPRLPVFSHWCASEGHLSSNTVLYSIQECTRTKLLTEHSQEKDDGPLRCQTRQVCSTNCRCRLISPAEAQSGISSHHSSNSPASVSLVLATQGRLIRACSSEQAFDGQGPQISSAVFPIRSNFSPLQSMPPHSTQ